MSYEDFFIRLFNKTLPLLLENAFGSPIIAAFGSPVKDHDIYRNCNFLQDISVLGFHPGLQNSNAYSFNIS